VSDIAAVLHTGEGDGIGTRIGDGESGIQSRSLPDHGEDATATGDDVAIMHARSRMEDQGTTIAGCLDPKDAVSSARMVRVSLCREDDSGGSAGDATERLRIDLPIRCREQGLSEVSLQQWEEHLGLGITGAAVELEDLWPAAGQDQSGEERADERPTHACHCGEDGAEDAVIDLLEEGGAVGVDGGGEGAHAAGVGAAVSIEEALVISRGRKADEAFAVTQRDDADLRADEAFLDDDARTGVAEEVIRQDAANCRFSVGA